MSWIGEKIKLSIEGASHGECMTAVLTGVPKGISIDFEQILTQMARRAPGNAAYGTTRKEADFPEIQSGFDGSFTNGDPIKAVIYNQNKRSTDYDALKWTPRPGHADYTAYIKFDGKEDMRGGGKFSGRLTAPLVFAGAVCRQILAQKGIVIGAHVKSIGEIKDVSFDNVHPDLDLLQRLNKQPFAVIDPDSEQKMLDKMAQLRKALDSAGGTVELLAAGVPAGLGDNLFDGTEGKIAPYLFGIPAVKGVSFGSGFSAAEMYGSENNDPFILENGKVVTKTNHCGGILGGITNGMPLWLTVAFKPTPSIARPQTTVDLQKMQQTQLEIHGRHDPCVVPRAVVCVESAVALALTDMLALNGKL